MYLNSANHPTIIGVDAGNKLVKTAHTEFIAGLDPISEAMIFPESDPMNVICYNGQNYRVSPEPTEWGRDKTGNPTYLLLSLIAIAKEIRARKLPPTLDIILCVGLPPGYMGATAIKRLKNYYTANGGEYCFICGQIHHRIRIRNVSVCPQGYSALMTLDESIVTKPSLHMIDIGGGTVDTSHLIGGENSNEFHSEDLGVIHMYTIIQDKMNARYERRITERQIDDILMRGSYTYFSQDHMNLISSEAEKHVDRIVKFLIKRGIDMESSFMLFMGGGSILLEKKIRKLSLNTLKEFSILNDIHANAKGYEIFTQIRLDF